ncbi:MAG TPA: flagellar biosynthetic protein FliO [Betaproteobacteria bacterium]|nr:flagellar biosynthetic protein FliO [Betaproteobacteria bacterium]
MPAAYSAAAPAAIPPSPLSFSRLLQVALGLSIVLAAVVGMTWLLRRFTSGHGLAGGALKIISGVAVGPKERVVLVELRDTWLVLGVAPGQVNMLHSLPKPESGGDLIPAEGKARAPHFSEWLNRAIKGRQRER